MKAVPRRASPRRPPGDLISTFDSAFLRALTEPARLEILKLLLMRGSANIETLAGQLPQDRSVISRHLTVLHRAGMVRTERIGRERIYAVDGPGIVGALERILAQAKAVMAGCCPPEDAPAARRSGSAI
jgi:DNA-binding transcriptional ArsR family regulator